MVVCDFVVNYNPKTDTIEDVSKRIIYSLYIARIKRKKPNVTFISGDSGEGKSISTLALMIVLLELIGVEYKKVVQDINVFTPLQYPEKLNKLLFDKELKKVNCICIHEAREVIKAKLWSSFLNQSISDINAMARSIKRMNTFIISQFIRDIDVSIRYTLTYYIKTSRPSGRKARLYIYKLWKDDRDLQKPLLKKRRVSGFLKYPNGRYRRYSPQYLEVKKPDNDVVKEFEKADYDAKSGIIKSKINKLIKEMKQDLNVKSKKVESMVDFYTENTETLKYIGKRFKGKWRVSKDFKERHELNKEEAAEFEEKLTKNLIKKGVIENEEAV